MPAISLTAVFANAAGELLPHPAGYLVLVYRPGAWGVAAIEELLEQAGALLLRRGWHRLLADARQMPAMTTPVKDWVARHWQGGTVPRPARLHIALLRPSEVVARLAVAQVQATAPDGISYAYFSTPEAAHGHLAALPV